MAGGLPPKLPKSDRGDVEKIYSRFSRLHDVLSLEEGLGFFLIDRQAGLSDR